MPVVDQTVTTSGTITWNQPPSNIVTTASNAPLASFRATRLAIQNGDLGSALSGAISTAGMITGGGGGGGIGSAFSGGNNTNFLSTFRSTRLAIQNGNIGEALTGALSGATQVAAMKNFSRAFGGSSSPASALLGSAPSTAMIGMAAQSLGSLFSQANTAGSVVRTGVPDPLVSAATKLVPEASGFITSAMRNQVDTVTLANASVGKSDLSQTDPLRLSAVANRLGVSVPTSDGGLADLKGMALTAASGRLLSGAASLSDVAGSSLTGVADKLTGTETKSDDSGGFGEWLSGAGKWVANKAEDVGNFFVKNLPAITQLTGMPIPGIPTNTNPTMMQTLITASQQLGVTKPLGNYQAMNYGDRQNLYNATYGMAITNNMAPVVNSISTSTATLLHSKDASIGTVLSGALGAAGPFISGQTLQAAANGIRGPLTNRELIVKGLIANPTLVKEVGDGLGNIFEKIGKGAEDLFGTKTMSKDDIVWNAPAVQANPKMADTITQKPLSKIVGGTAVESLYFA